MKEVEGPTRMPVGVQTSRACVCVFSFVLTARASVLTAECVLSFSDFT